METITGYTDAELAELEIRIELAMRTALRQVMDAVVRRIESARPAVAAGFGRLLVADAAPPGQPYVSPDDLASITPLWQEAVAAQLMPVVTDAWNGSTRRVRASMVEATGLTELPSISSLAAEQYLAAASNTFDAIGNDLWETSRNELLDGFAKGESIDELALRLRASADLTARNAVTVARTQIIEVSNAGSITTARVGGMQMRKEWLATPDARTRPTHKAADGQRVHLDETFVVGGRPADFPGAPGLPPEERHNCRCTLGYVMSESQIRTAVKGSVSEPLLPNTVGIEPRPAAGPASAIGLPDIPTRRPPSVRAALKSAKTTRELQKAWRAEYQRVSGHDVSIQIPLDASLLTMREYAEGVLRGLERFPDVRVREISWWIEEGGAFAQANGDTLQFNAIWASMRGRPALLRSLRNCVRGWDRGSNGWFTRAAGQPTSVAIHEFGHILDMGLGGRIHSRALSAAHRLAGQQEIEVDTLIARDISIYATSDEFEFVAEAFADVIARGEAASSLSREIYGLLRAEYRKAELAEPAVTELAPAAIEAQLAKAASGLGGKTVPELRALARERGIKIPAGSRKADIAKLLEQSDAPVAAPPLVDLPRLTIPKLRVLAKERGIKIPAGSRKADIVRLLEGLKTVRSLDRVALEIAARQRQADIDVARGLADVAGEVYSLLAKGVSDRALLHRLGAEMRITGIDTTGLQALIADREGMSRAVDEMVADAGLTPLGTVGDRVRFNPRLHVQSDGLEIHELVVVDRPGWRLNLRGEDILISRATVS